MGHVAFLLAFVGLPVLSFYFVRSLTWVAVYVAGAVSLAGLGVGKLIELGWEWNFLTLQVVLLVALLAVTVVAFLSGRQGSVPLRRQVLAVIVPVIVIVAFVGIARYVAIPTSGAFTAVGYFVDHANSEDNAKWLDFSSQLSEAGSIQQQVYLGGPLQLFIVFVATAMAVVSTIAFGGVNEVFVASNAVMYGQFLLVALVPFALAPLAEVKVAVMDGSTGRRRREHIPAPVVWVGVVVLAAGSMAVVGLGHLTLQFTFLIVALWLAVFLVRTRVARAGVITSLAMAIVSTVWFPLMPVSVIILVAVGAWFVVRAVRARSLLVLDVWEVVAWGAAVLMMARPTVNALRYMTDQASGAVASGFEAGAGGIRAAARIPALDLLVSGGGTEATGPLLALLAGASALLAALFIARRRTAAGRFGRWRPFAPAILLVAYALGLSLLGTWWAGSGPAYGAVKLTFLASVSVAAVTLPLALMEVDRRRSGVTVVRVVAAVAVVYLLTIDTLLPRAFTIVSPSRWPVNIGADKGYWWPAEVRDTADQSIAGNPIGCAYLPQGAEAPSALPNGQTVYNCNRILAGLSGYDWEAQPVVDWARREWLTNEAAWTAVWPGFLMMPEEVRQKNLILLDLDNNVIGLESINSLMDRYRPLWAEGPEDFRTAMP